MSTAVALIDLTFGLAWIGSRMDLRRRCFEQIEDVLGATQRLGSCCYDESAIAGWVLEQWPDRAHAASAGLKVPPPLQQLVLWEHLPEDVREDLRELLLRRRRRDACPATPVWRGSRVRFATARPESAIRHTLSLSLARKS